MRVTWLGAGAVAAAVATGLVAPTLGSSRAPAPRPVPPKTLTVDGVVVRLAGVEEVVAVRLADDPATLVVHAGRVRPGPPTACHDHTEVRLLAQGASEVRVGTYRYAVRTAGRGTVCYSIRRPVAESRLALAAPLGARRVVANDAPARVHDPRDLLRPTVLPGGVARSGTVTFDPATAVWTTVHAGPRPGQRLMLRQGPPGHVAVGAYSTRSAAVGGRVVTVGRVFGGTCLSWRESAAVDVAACVQGSPVPLSLDELVRVVEGLHIDR